MSRAEGYYHRYYPWLPKDPYRNPWKPNPWDIDPYKPKTVIEKESHTESLIEKIIAVIRAMGYSQRIIYINHHRILNTVNITLDTMPTVTKLHITLDGWKIESVEVME